MSQVSSAGAFDPTPPPPPMPPVPPVPWTRGIAPRFIALFLLIIYLDRLGLQGLLTGGLVPSVIGAVLGGVLAFLLFFRPMALWGLDRREPIERLAIRTFGTVGARLVTRLVLTLLLTVWFAIVIREAIDVTMRSLIALGFLDARHLEPRLVWGWHIPSLLFLWVAVAWSITSAILGSLAYKLVAAVMAGYQPFVAFTLAALALWAIPTARGFQPFGHDVVTAQVPDIPGLWAVMTLIQWVCAYFATVAIVSADWGMASRDASDIDRGGLTGIAFAAPVMATLGFLFVAGTLGRPEHAPTTAAAMLAHAEYQTARLGESQATSIERERHNAVLAGGGPFRIRELIQHELPRWPAGIVLMMLAIGLLGPACFTPYMIGRFLSDCWPSRPGWAVSLPAAFATWPMIAFGIDIPVERIIPITGVLIGPLLAAMAADRARDRLETARPPRPVRLGTFAACLVGVSVGLLPTIADRLGLELNLHPSIVFGYLATYGIVRLLPGSRLVAPATQPDLGVVSSEAPALAPPSPETSR